MFKNLFILMIFSLSSFAKIQDETSKKILEDSNKFGDSISNFANDMQKNLVEPMTSEQDFTTADGKTKFNANLTCSNAKVSFMKISYQLRNNNAVEINIDIDREMSGRKEYHFNANNITSICSKGLMSCNGKDCKGYSYTMDSSHKFIKSDIDVDLLGHCMCVDASCGSLSVNSKQGTLEEISKLFYPIVANAYSNAVITKSVSNSQYIEFYGEKPSNCDPTNGSNFAQSKPLPKFDYENLPPQNTVEELSSPSYQLIVGGIGKNQQDNNQTIQSAVHSIGDKDGGISGKIIKNTQANNPDAQKNMDMNYPEYDANGNLISSKHTNINASGESLEEKFCEVSWKEVNADVFSDGTNRQDLQKGRTVEQHDLRRCTNDICPIDSKKGETIKTPCGKIDHMKDAMANMGIIEELSKDIMCGTK